MSDTALRFFKRFHQYAGKDSDVPDFFVYHLTIERGEPAATAQGVRACYRACDLAEPSWLASHLSNGLKSKPKRFVKQNGGYRLEHRRREQIADLLGTEQPSVQTSASLDKLEERIVPGPKREFLRETISCFEVGANRAAVVMCWNLTVHHLQDHVMAKPSRHMAFNAMLSQNKDSRVKIKVITKQDDFTEISESKFLHFCREAKLITSSLFKKLQVRLDERNAAAHPSGLNVTQKSAEAFIEDLVENVIVKFPA
jgi:hypothetical protein